MTSDATRKNESLPLKFKQVFKNEIDELKKHSPECSEGRLVGLALSGGGIRSATFNLGLIQALAKNDLLNKFDYLSTVSGGGYIGSWLVSWASRKEKENNGEHGDARSQGPSDNGIAKVQKILKKNCDSSQNNITSPEPEPVAWLRRYSNYLTPRKGLFSLDTLTGVTYHVRNVFLSSLVTGLFVFGMIALLAAATLTSGLLSDTHAAFISGSGLAAGFLANVWLWFRLPLVAGESSPSMGVSPYRGYKRTVWIIAFLIVAHSTILAVIGLSPFLNQLAPYISWIDITPPKSTGFHLVSGLILFFGYAIAAWLGLASSSFIGRTIRNRFKLGCLALLGAIPFLVLGGYLHNIPSWLGFEPNSFWRHLPSAWELWGIIAPLICLLVSFAASVHLGIVGRMISTEAYFWVSRVAGKMVQFSIAFAFPAITFLVFPTLFDWTEAILSIGGISAAYAIIARWLAASPSTGATNGNKDGWQNKISEGVVSAAPFILMLALIGFAAWGIRDAFGNTKTPFYNTLSEKYPYTCQDKTTLSEQELANSKKQITLKEINSGLQGKQTKVASDCTPSLHGYYDHNIRILNSIYFPMPLWCGLSSLALALLLARLINANLFSLHSYYKNRLTNAYLAASNKQENRDVDIGVHHSDAIKLQDLANVKPYLLANTTLNLVGKESNLAWQDRKAASFVMSPLYCGYAIESMEDGHKEYFQPTSTFVRDPIKLNLAMTISGAAGSPMGGFHTKPGVSMLLALAGVRLGWWLPNPAKPDAWHGKLDAWLGRPDTSLLTTFPRELLGRADEEGNVVYLSDGGHFENLGIYELVRRRCALIVASDASADPDFEFDDLARAIHNIRADFGVEIEIDDVTSLRPQKDSAEGETIYRFSRNNFVTGKIKYSNSPIEEFREQEKGGERPDGDLIYIKSSIPKSVEKDAVDILYYASAHNNFPHEPTSDQWFSEEQFEAYRKLGFLIGQKAAKQIEEKFPT